MDYSVILKTIIMIVVRFKTLKIEIITNNYNFFIMRGRHNGHHSGELYNTDFFYVSYISYILIIMYYYFILIIF